MALIERFTPGGNFYPDGSSTFAVLVTALRKIAETRDTVDASLRSTITTGDTNTLSAATTQIGAAETRANSYTNESATTTLVTAGADAQSKADTAESNAKAHADAAAATAKTEANAYTDISFAATAPGGATDEAVDAAVDRAVLGGRISTATRVEPGVIEINLI